MMLGTHWEHTFVTILHTWVGMIRVLMDVLAHLLSHKVLLHNQLVVELWVEQTNIWMDSPTGCEWVEI